MTLNIDVKEANHHRHVNDIFKMIDDSTLPKGLNIALIFEIIGQAEAKIHGMSFEEVHFMKWGNGLYYRYYWWVYCTRTTIINTLYCSAIPTGHDKINIAHGIYIIPAPATAEILKVY